MNILSFPGVKMKESVRSVGVLGTGDFARALTKRLFYSGYDVTIGSRRPETKALSAIDDCFCNVSVVSTEECIKGSSIIFVAVHVENFRDLLEEHVDYLAGKILIDVSNRDRPSLSHSNAEYLQKLVPCAKVVKAFNVMSAYSMENDYNTSSRNIFLAGNDENARALVANIARDMNFNAVDYGGIRAARRIEAHPLRLFMEWRGPIGFSVAIFNIWLLFLIYIYYVEKTVYEWEQIFVKVLNKAICMTGITTLAVTYLASSVAAVYQIYYGTKHIRFARWLDKWLKNRKQLGLVSFTLIFCHVIMSVLIMSPTYLRSWYHNTKIIIPFKVNETFVYNNINWMTWKGEAACLTGIVSFIILCFIAATTLPSVTDSLNWREWRFVQSKLGHLALLIAVIHVAVMGLPGWIKTPSKIYKSITFLSSIVPWITLVLKLFFCIPCVDRYVIRIRKGWERRPENCKGKCIKPIKKEGYVAMKMEDDATPSTSALCPCPGDAVQMIHLEEGNCECAADQLG